MRPGPFRCVAEGSMTGGVVASAVGAVAVGFVGCVAVRVFDRVKLRRAMRRILVALISVPETTGAELKRRGVVGPVYCYAALHRLEVIGAVKARELPGSAARQGIPVSLYSLTEMGRGRGLWRVPVQAMTRPAVELIRDGVESIVALHDRHRSEPEWDRLRDRESDAATHPCDDWRAGFCMCRGACSCHWRS